MSTWEDDLLDAIRQDNEDKFDSILNSPKVQNEIKAINEWKHVENPLVLVVIWNHQVMLEKLLDAGVNVNSFHVFDDKNKCTALHWAVYANSISSVKILIKYQANQRLKGKWSKQNK